MRLLLPLMLIENKLNNYVNCGTRNCSQALRIAVSFNLHFLPKSGAVKRCSSDFELLSSGARILDECCVA